MSDVLSKAQPLQKMVTKDRSVFLMSIVSMPLVIRLCATWVVIVLLIAFSADWIAPYSYSQLDLLARLTPPVLLGGDAAQGVHILGKKAVEAAHANAPIVQEGLELGVDRIQIGGDQGNVIHTSSLQAEHHRSRGGHHWLGRHLVQFLGQVGIALGPKNKTGGRAAVGHHIDIAVFELGRQFQRCRFVSGQGFGGQHALASGDSQRGGARSPGHPTQDFLGEGGVVDGNHQSNVQGLGHGGLGGQKERSGRHGSDVARLDLRPRDGMRGLPGALWQGAPMQGAQFAKLVGQTFKMFAAIGAAKHLPEVGA